MLVGSEWFTWCRSQRIASLMSPSQHSKAAGAVGGSLDDDPQYMLIGASNELVASIDADIAAVHRYVADLYAAKFAELESMVTNPIDYFKVVNIIRNETVSGCTRAQLGS